jgi:hypothetical protein
LSHAPIQSRIVGMRRLLLLLAAATALSGCARLFEPDLPAFVTIRCGDDSASGWATPIEVTDDGWGSYIITSYDLVDACVHGEPVDLDARTVIENEVDLVRVRAGSTELVGHVYGWDEADGLASVVVRESLEFVDDGSPPRVGDEVAVSRAGSQPSSLGTLTRADREALLTSVALRRSDRGAAILDGGGDAVGTVIVKDGALRAVPLPNLCRSLLDCAETPDARWPGWP